MTYGLETLTEEIERHAPKAKLTALERECQTKHSSARRNLKQGKDLRIWKHRENIQRILEHRKQCSSTGRKSSRTRGPRSKMRGSISLRKTQSHWLGTWQWISNKKAHGKEVANSAQSTTRASSWSTSWRSHTQQSATTMAKWQSKRRNTTCAETISNHRRVRTKKKLSAFLKRLTTSWVQTTPISILATLETSRIMSAYAPKANLTLSAQLPHIRSAIWTLLTLHSTKDVKTKKIVHTIYTQCQAIVLAISWTLTKPIQ